MPAQASLGPSRERVLVLLPPDGRWVTLQVSRRPRHRCPPLHWWSRLVFSPSDQEKPLLLFMNSVSQSKALSQVTQRLCWPCHSTWSLCGSTIIIWEKRECRSQAHPPRRSQAHSPPCAVASESAFSQGCSWFPRAWETVLYASSLSRSEHTPIFWEGGQLMGWVLQYHMPVKSLLPCKLFLGILLFFFRCHSISVVGLACLWNPIPYGLTPSVHQSKVSFIHCWTSYRPTRYLQIWFNASGHAMIEKIPTLPHSKIAGSFFSHDHIRAHANSHSNCTIHSL